MVDAVEGRADRLLLRRRGRRRVRLDRRATRRQRLDPRLVPRPPRRDGRRTSRACILILHGAEDKGYPLTTVDRVVDELRGAKVPFQLEVYSGTGHGFSAAEEQGRGARQRAVDRHDRADAQGAVRHLSAAVRSARRSREVGRSSRAASRAPMDQRSHARGFGAALALPLIRLFSVPCDTQQSPSA